jgi:GDPmannose 4,6-dehydratase
VKEMVAADLHTFKRDKYLKEGGHDVMNYHE